MFNFNELKTIHIELTNNCQASCPMCTRNIHSGLNNPLLKLVEWSLDEFKSIINQHVINTIDKIYFCGNFGDPMLHDDLIEICEYLKQSKPSLMISIHTNGGARKTSWWQELARAMPKNHMVHFAIDGLEDTHHLYRVGTKYSTVVRNARAFIDAGGRAEWVFIKFKHNEHQVDECRRLAEEYKFETFQLKNSSRFLIEPKYDVLDKEGNVTHIVEPPTESIIKFMPREVIDSYKEVVKSAKIDCFVKQQKEIYIDAYKTITPCCWVGSTPYITYDTNIGFEVSSVLKNQYSQLVSELGGLDKLNAMNGIDTVISDEVWQTIWEKKWTTDKLVTCARTCGKFEEATFSQPMDQFVDSTSF